MTYSYIKIGMEKYNSDDYQGSIKAFTEALKNNINDQDLYVWRGTAYEDMGNDLEAEKDFKRAIDINPNFLSMYRYGMVKFRENNIYEAIKWLKRSYDSFPSYTTKNLNIGSNNILHVGKQVICANLGSFLLQENNLDESLRYSKEAVEIDPKYPNPLVNVGIVLFLKGNLEEAISYMKQAIELGYTQAEDTLKSMQQDLSEKERNIDIRIEPDYVNDTLMISQLKVVKNIDSAYELKNYISEYLKQTDIHPVVVGAAIEMFYSWGEEQKCVLTASRLRDLAPIPTMLEYGSTWWNGVGLYLAYPLINVKTQPEADTTILRKVVFTAYTALCIGSSLAKGKAYDTLNIRFKIMHKYQNLFKSFVQKEIDSHFGNFELYSMMFCDGYVSMLSYHEEGLMENFNKTKDSLQIIYNWFANNQSDDGENDTLFKQGDQFHMKYNPDFVQAYNDRKFTFTSSEYRQLFFSN